MKKLLSLALALLLVLSLMPSAFAEEPEEIEAEPEEPAPEPVAIASLEDFLAFAGACALESYSRDRVFRLETDLDLSGADFSPIPYFAGTFLGRGHRITGLELLGEGSRVGLFRRVAEGAVLRDLDVQGRVTPGGTRLYAGGLVGVNAGTVENCGFSGTVTGLENVGGIVGLNESTGLIASCRFDGDVRAEHQAGGVAGDNRGEIADCRTAGGVNNVQIIPERKQSFDLSAFSEDDFLDLSNIGGIAGYNGGRIRSCFSEAEVGYAYTGYNVGGIAGKSAGYLSACENRGLIRGRRDVGGIVGQLIPHTAWDFSDGRLNGLPEELQRLDDLLSAASRNTQAHSAAIRTELTQLRGSTGDAIDELKGVMTYYTGGMTGDLLDPESGLPEVSLTGADLSGLNSALDRVYAESLALSAEIGAAAGSVSDDLLAVNAQLSRVLDCMSGLLGTAKDETLFESYDLSADETYEHELGAVDGCLNSGNVEAESSAGGIAGSMAYELSFDMEDRLRASDLITSDARRYLFAALRGCRSSGEISVRSDCAGGVVGRAELGAVADCTGMGSVTSLKGGYVGGVAGTSGGSIRSCLARVELRGGSYVGGVAGSGFHILDCAAWASIERGAEYLGAVAGWAEGEVHGNRYVESSPAGVDGVSLLGACEPVTVEELLALDGVPADFGNVELRFFVGDRLLETQTLPFGGSAGELPEVPAEGARRWHWDDFDRDRVCRSMDIRGSWSSPQTTLSSGEDLPLFLAEGEFAEGQQLSVRPVEVPLPEEDVLAACSLTVEGYDQTLTVRMRAESGGRLCLIGEDGSLSDIPYERDKSYLVFTLDNGASFVYLRQEPAAGKLPWIAAGGGAAALLLGLGLLLRKRRKKAVSPEETADLTD